LGYDYATTHASDMSFPVQAGEEHLASRSMNLTSMIHDRASFQAYSWPDPDKCDFGNLEHVAAALEPGMKIIVFGPCGVLENVMAIVGYEMLCLMLADDPDLVREVFDAVGSRLYRYYEIALQHPAVGAVIINDDWGFATQTMFSPDQMRQYVFPWHQRMVELAHRANRPAILHSCGQLEAIWEDIIEVLRYDGKHSYEDKILPVEEAYERYGRRIAILGGIDLDYVCRRTPQEVEARSRAMLERAATRGAYALGTGNSVPEYVPPVNYFAMIRAATGSDYSEYRLKA
jgi:uroporphyrinogen decarboxylase